jgi:hypothetical protein
METVNLAHHWLENETDEILLPSDDDGDGEKVRGIVVFGPFGVLWKSQNRM